MSNTNTIKLVLLNIKNLCKKKPKPEDCPYCKKKPLCDKCKNKTLEKLCDVCKANRLPEHCGEDYIPVGWTGDCNTNQLKGVFIDILIEILSILHILPHGLIEKLQGLELDGISSEFISLTRNLVEDERKRRSKKEWE